jgi:hypothetical protein
MTILVGSNGNGTIEGMTDTLGSIPPTDKKVPPAMANWRSIVCCAVLK